MSVLCLQVKWSCSWRAHGGTKRSAKVGNMVLRNARFRHEFLLQLGFMKIGQVVSGMECVVVLEGAVPLRHGKRAWQCFLVGCDYLPLIRRMGVQGIISTFYVFDGLLPKSLSRHFRARRDTPSTVEWEELRICCCS